MVEERNECQQQSEDVIEEIQHHDGPNTSHKIELLSSCIRKRPLCDGISICMRNVSFRSSAANRVLLEQSVLRGLFTFPFMLVSLELCDCELKDSFALSLADRMRRHSLPALRRIQLAGNSISDVDALVQAVPKGIEEIDLSRNRLTQHGILAFGELLKTPSRCPRLKLLHLACSSHCISLSTFQQFATIIEDNFSIQSLTIGHEVLNWFNDTVPKEWKEMDAFLAYWWLEPAYRSVTDRIRFLLVINHAFDGTKHSVYSVLRRVQPKQQAEAMYRMLKQNPLLLRQSIEVSRWKERTERLR